MTIALVDHVAFVVADLDRALQDVSELGLQPGNIETFPSEGTREVYLDVSDRAGRVLLMQPTCNEGPYARALERRGEGLHHIALQVPQVEDFVRDFVRPAFWYLHPASLDAHSKTNTIWLARPGVGTLVEVQGSSNPRVARQSAIDRIVVAGLDAKPSLASVFQHCDVPVSAGAQSGVVVSGRPYFGISRD